MKSESFAFKELEDIDGFNPEIEDSPNTLILFFCDRLWVYQELLLKKIKDQYPAAIIVGSSSAGEILGSEVVIDSAVLSIIKFEQSELRLLELQINEETDFIETGANLGQELLSHESELGRLAWSFIVSDGIVTNASKLLLGMQSVLSESTLISGGLAGDGDRFQETLIISRASTAPRRILVLGVFSDALKATAAAGAGWKKFGVERRITRAEGNKLYELDGEPALDLYKKYLGKYVDRLPASALLFPLSIKGEKQNDEKLIIRTILGINEDDHSMFFAGDIPNMGKATLMYASPDSLVKGATDAVAKAMEGHIKPDFTLCVSCIGRRLVLRHDTGFETQAVSDHVGSKSQLIGFYSYGEISPDTSYKSVLHNQTMTVTCLSETGV